MCKRKACFHKSTLLSNQLSKKYNSQRCTPLIYFQERKILHKSKIILTVIYLFIFFFRGNAKLGNSFSFIYHKLKLNFLLKAMRTRAETLKTQT